MAEGTFVGYVRDDAFSASLLGLSFSVFPKPAGNWCVPLYAAERGDDVRFAILDEVARMIGKCRDGEYTTAQLAEMVRGLKDQIA